jgi:hypothetical protein
MICVYHRDLGAFDCSRQASEMFHASQSALKDATDYVRLLLHLDLHGCDIQVRFHSLNANNSLREINIMVCIVNCKQLTFIDT